MSYFNLICAAYLLLKENNISTNKRLRRIIITTGLKKLYVTVVIKGKSIIYEKSINTVSLIRFDFYTYLKCVLTSKGNIQTLSKAQNLVLQTIERV